MNEGVYRVMFICGSDEIIKHVALKLHLETCRLVSESETPSLENITRALSGLSSRYMRITKHHRLTAEALRDYGKGFQGLNPPEKQWILLN